MRKSHDSPWKSVENNENPQKIMKSYENPWKTIRRKDSMKAIVIHEPGGPEKLCYEEVPVPAVREGWSLATIRRSLPEKDSHQV